MPIFKTNTGSLGSLQVSGSSIISASAENLIKFIGSGSAILSVSGSTGGIFQVSDFNSANNQIATLSSGSVRIFSVDRLKTVEISGSLIVTGSITGSMFGTSSYALTASFAQNAGASFPYVGDAQITGSLFVSQSIYAKNIQEANVSAGSFTGNPKTFAVTGLGFTGTAYSVSIIGEDARSWSIENKTSGGFTINSNSNVALAGTTTWIAIEM